MNLEKLFHRLIELIIICIIGFSGLILAEAPSADKFGNTNTKAENLIFYAKSFLNCKYSYGGTSPNGFDCSGFTRFIFSQFGYTLPHKASAQITIGEEIEKASLQKGDLVFFKTLGASHINHVGIYLGEGNFIHASSGAGYVTISSLISGYYSTRFQSARRVIQLTG